MNVLDQLGVLKLVTGRLDGAGVPYMVTGSIAAGHYGQPRMTRDIDLVVDLQPQDAERIATLFALDWPYLERWADSLGVFEALREVRP